MKKQQDSRIEKTRPAKACNTCRRKKVKCDGKRPICSSCIIFKLPCGFEDTGTRPSRPSRAYVEELEQRVKCMDDELQRLSRGNRLPQEDTTGHASLPPRATADGPGNPDRPAARQRGEEDVLIQALPADDETSQLDPDTSDQPSCVLRAQDGKMRFFGASSGFGLHVAQASNPLKRKQLNVDWKDATRRSAVKWPLTNWVPRILQDNFEKRMIQPLPSKETTLSLVADFLSSFNRIIPLVDENCLLRLVERQFSWNPDDSPSSWALLNVVMAFSYSQRAQKSTDSGNDWQKSLGHVKNALNVLVDLFLRNADLLAVQGILGLALYFQGTPNAQALFMLAASAMRLSHSIGLHRNNTLGFTPAEIEERRRVFWIAFILDADISLRVGRPPVQDFDDYNTPLPAELPQDGLGMISIDATPINFFRQLAQFATVQRLVYRHLQTIAVIQQPKEIALESAKGCEDALLQWKSSALKVFQPENIFASEPNDARTHLLRLNLAYHCCYAKLRQLSSVTSTFSDSSLSETSSDVEKDVVALCLRATDSSRSALALLPCVKLLGSKSIWNTVYFFATASVALASEIHIHPDYKSSDYDLSMIHETTEFLAKVSSEEPGTFVDFILSVCSDLKCSAKCAIREAQGDFTNPLATGNNESSVNANTSTSEAEQHAVPIDQGVFNQVDFLTGSNESFNAQYSVPPFWNFQDLFAGMP